VRPAGTLEPEEKVLLFYHFESRPEGGRRQGGVGAPVCGLARWSGSVAGFLPSPPASWRPPGTVNSFTKNSPGSPAQANSRTTAGGRKIKNDAQLKPALAQRSVDGHPVSNVIPSAQFLQEPCATYRTALCFRPPRDDRAHSIIRTEPILVRIGANDSGDSVRLRIEGCCCGGPSSWRLLLRSSRANRQTCLETLKPTSDSWAAGAALWRPG